METSFSLVQTDFSVIPVVDTAGNNLTFFCFYGGLLTWFLPTLKSLVALKGDFQTCLRKREKSWERFLFILNLVHFENNYVNLRQIPHFIYVELISCLVIYWVNFPSCIYWFLEHWFSCVGEKIHNLLIHPVVLTLLPKVGEFGESRAVYLETRGQRCGVWEGG